MLEEFNHLYIARKQLHLLNWQSVLPTFQILNKSYKEACLRTSVGFNLFEVQGLKEVQHSRIVGNLLDPNGSHKQGCLFLFEFLKKLAIKDIDAGKWEVTIETSRLDIHVFRRNPYSSIIIENKSNEAVDQLNQLYRYYYNHIHVPARSMRLCENADRFRVVYLLPRKSKAISSHSIDRPSEYNVDAPETVPAHLLNIMSFDEEISFWIDSCLNLLHAENHTMRMYLEHYKEYFK